MDDPEIVLKRLKLIQRHIKHVQEACEIIGEKLIREGRAEFGLKLIANSYLHDNSKFSYFEFNYLFQSEDKDLLKLAIEAHNHANLHHPSAWGGIEHMDALHLAECSCDLYARSQELGTSIDDYLKDVYFPKHNVKVNSRVYKTIRMYIGMLVEKFEKI